MDNQSGPQIYSGTVDVAGLVEQQRANLFHLQLAIISFIVALADGYDLSVAGLIAPSLVKEFTVPAAALGFLFSAGLAGMVLGAIIFAFIGDRFGRKAGVVAGTFVFGAFTFASAFATNLQTLALLRFLTGIGLAGILPNLVSLNAEYAPKRVRSFFVGFVLVGVPFGGVVAAWCSALVQQIYGWRSLLLGGGCVAVALGFALLWLLPESIKYLALRPTNEDRIKKLVRRIYGEDNVPTSIAPVATEESTKAGISPTPLLQPGYRFATVMLWCLCFINYGVVYYVFSWAPTIFRALGFSGEQTGYLISVMPIGGILGSVLISALMVRWGTVLVGTLILTAMPAIAAIGSTQTNLSASAIWCALLGFSLVGCQTGLLVVSGLIYATPIRAKGAGWAAGVGRLGSVIGPLAGSVLLNFLPLKQILLAPIVPLALSLVATIALTGFMRRTLGSFQIFELPTSEQATGQVTQSASSSAR
ncbi:MFS transporter [Trinickia terrae]|uniref:MFS transporter n=1 Tax=Trinickia terrae TaxID=2571161 RepID=A0A4V5PKZ0_9BURK|nr:MFS transporter [Trinickia terrae]TKC90040.1 MFS transporter [Trinickia terrae]